MFSALARLSSLALIFCVIPLDTYADAKADMAEMQRRLNQEVMESEFETEDLAKIDSFIKDAMQKDLKPKTNPPQNWQSGYTCDSYYRRYYRYNYYGYRDCLYHYRYYGRYW